MKQYYSPSTGGFHRDDIWGEREIPIPDPNWVHPVLEDGSLDPDVEPRTILVKNPDCKIPSDAVFVSEEYHQELMKAQFSDGKRIVPDEYGNPIAVDQAKESKEEITARIKKERDRRIQTGGYKVDEKWFHSDTFSRTQQMNLKALGSDIPADLLWKTMDGTSVLMTNELATQICTAQVVSDNVLFNVAENIIVGLDNAEDFSEYYLSVIWPKIYGE